MDKLKTIKAETEELLKKMIDKFDVEVEEDNDMFHVVIKAEEEAPTVIGRHGETIRAVQKILEVMLYKKFGEPVDLLVNVNDYREKQKERLEQIAENIAKRAMEEKEEVSLRSFSSYERKVVHEYIATNHPDLTSYSVGEGRERQLIVSLKKQEDGKEE
ncbi:KH domain-containing protein [Candidatus Roizmanbacteria bacterium]|nr:KH domain-containing protein [Candidatus Roizmanbacteria bacterium]